MRCCQCCREDQTNPRTVDFDSKLNKEHPNNSIKTTKYNIITFLPKAVILQFIRPANTVYLVTAIVQSIPIISSLSPITAIAPFAFVIGLALIREAYEDYIRYTKDKQTNERVSRVLREGQFVEVQWKDIVVGDIVKVLDDEEVPADMVLLYSTEENSICYVETANLDGESNLKTKSALHEGISQYPEQFHKIKGHIEVEAPNSDLHEFHGQMLLDGQAKRLIDFQNFLIRGTSLRNTAYVAGIVVYAGKSTKIMCNQSDVHHKVSNVEKKVNKIQLFLFLVLCLLSLGCSIGYYEYHTRYGNHTRQAIWYLKTSNVFNMKFESFLIFWTSFLLLSFIIPVSMNVSLELVKFFQGVLISFDKKMYYEPIDKYCKVLNMSIIEQLGLIDYVLTDKTGTLTANEMKFQFAWVDGKNYESTELQEAYERNKRASQSPEQKIFWDSVIICHDVVVDNKKGEFQGSSPDEVCFVEFADKIGYTFLKRTKNSIEIKVEGQKKAYEFLHMLPFTSRKRMSVLVRDLEKKKIYLHTKGADSAIFEVATTVPQKNSLDKALQDFSKEGLRTLVFAKREVSEQEYSHFMERINELKQHKIKGDLSKERLEQMDERITSSIEVNLEVIGASAIEDRLQDGVPETIARLGQAGIKVMMITGDKLQTAENIGYLSAFIDRESTVFRLRSGTPDLLVQVKKILATIDYRTNLEINGQMNQPHQVQLVPVPAATSNNRLSPAPLEDEESRANSRKVCVLIEGDMISKLIDEDNFQPEYAELLLKSHSVIFCRSTPKEKAKIVKFVKRELKGLVLAIGDGGNDVGMIEQANVGVGLVGKEGNQASASSDFYFGQFRYLDRLLLHHGRWGYYRMSYFFVYYGWKNMIMTLLIFYFLIDSAYSGYPAFSEVFISIYNAFIGLMLLLYYSILEQDINDDTYEQAYASMPIFYKQFKKMELFSYKRYGIWTLMGIILSLFINFLINGALSATDAIDSHGRVGDFKAQAEAGAIGLSFAVCLVIIADIYNFTCCTIYVVIILLTVVACWAAFILQNFIDLGSVTGALTDNTNMRFWAVIFMIGAISYAVKYLYASLEFLIWPRDTQKVMIRRYYEKNNPSVVQAYNIPSREPESNDNMVEPKIRDSKAEQHALYLH